MRARGRLSVHRTSGHGSVAVRLSLRRRRLHLPRRVQSSDRGRGHAPQRRVVRGHRGESPGHRSRLPSPRRPRRFERRCAGHRSRPDDRQTGSGRQSGKNRWTGNSRKSGWRNRLAGTSRYEDRAECSSLRRRPLRLRMLRWRLLRAAFGLRGGCVGRPVAGSVRDAGWRPIRLLSATSNSVTGRAVPRPGGRWCSRRSLRSGRRNRCGPTACSRAESCRNRRCSSVGSNHRRWRRCRRGIGGERRRGADDQRWGNQGRSRSVRACQGETLASSLLLKTVFSCTAARRSSSPAGAGGLFETLEFLNRVSGGR